MTRASRLVPLALAMTLGACATPARTIQLRAFLGATADGGWSFAELNSFPGEKISGRVRQIGPDGKAGPTESLAPEQAAHALSIASRASERQERTAEGSLGSCAPAGFEVSRAKTLAADHSAGLWLISEWAGLPAELELRREQGELKLLVRLASAPEEIVAYRLPDAGATWISSVLLLPGGRRALALTGSVSSSPHAVHRLEGLGEVDLGMSVAALLDTRAVRLIEAGDLTAAMADLQHAIQIAPDDANSHYNLACAFALANDEDRALMALGRAVDLDPDRLKPLALSDPDLASLRTRVEFRLMVEPRSPGSVPY